MEGLFLALDEMVSSDKLGFGTKDSDMSLPIGLRSAESMQIVLEHGA